MIINTIVPFLFIYGEYTGRHELHQKALDWLEQLPSEKNGITRLFAQLGLEVNSALQSQALLQLKSNYCDTKRCLECRFGHEILRKNTSMQHSN